MISMPLAGLLLLVAIGVSTPYAAVFALMATFFMVELNEGAYWAANHACRTVRHRRRHGWLNTGGNVAGMVSAPIIGALSGAGNWNLTFVIGAVFAVVAGCAGSRSIPTGACKACAQEQTPPRIRMP